MMGRDFGFGESETGDVEPEEYFGKIRVPLECPVRFCFVWKRIYNPAPWYS
jgi:hypothetical protein